MTARIVLSVLLLLAAACAAQLDDIAERPAALEDLDAGPDATPAANGIGTSPSAR